MKCSNNTNCQEAFAQLIAYIRGNYKTAVNLPVLSKAFEVAMDHASEKDDDLTHLLLRNLKVAQDMALLQCQVSLLACAILLDVPRATINALRLKNVSEILDAYDALSCFGESSGYKNQLPDHLYHAVQLRCAKVHRELQEDSGVPMYNSAFLQNVLIPFAANMKMRYYVRLLNNDCYAKSFWYGQKHSYTEVMTHIQMLKSVSMDTYNTFDALMLGALSAQSRFSLLSKDDGNCMLRNALSTWDVKEQIIEAGSKERSMLDLWEVTLSYDGNDEDSMVREYIAFHREFLSDNLTVQYVGKEDHCVTFRLTDFVENNYLIRLIPQSELRSYYLGDRNTTHLTHCNRTNIPCITVYAMEDNECRKIMIPADATALDLAFYVSPTDAVAVQSVRICQMTSKTPPVFNDTDHRYPLHTSLKENDVVAFDVALANSGCHESCASIDWFALINTDYAKTCLIKYLKEQD